MTKTWIISVATTALILGACATSQENPNYQYSSKYKNGSPAQATTSYASYQAPATTTYSTTTSTTNHACLNKETNRELIGAAAGGTIGAIAGKKLIGGTKGTLAGAALGGAAGFGIADKTIDCDPLPMAGAPVTMSTPQSTTYSAQGYPQAGAVDVTPPTDQYYAGETVTGTPGYQAIHGTDAPAPIAQPQAMAEAPVTAEPQVITQTISGPIVAAGAYGSEVVNYDYSENIVSANAEATPMEFSETRIIPAKPAFGEMYSVRQGDTVYSLARQRCLSVTDIQSANGLGPNFGIQIGQSLSLPPSRC